jgi:hypothetical protein
MYEPLDMNRFNQLCAFLTQLPFRLPLATLRVNTPNHVRMAGPFAHSLALLAATMASTGGICSSAHKAAVLANVFLDEHPTSHLIPSFV